MRIKHNSYLRFSLSGQNGSNAKWPQISQLRNALTMGLIGLVLYWNVMQIGSILSQLSH